VEGYYFAAGALVAWALILTVIGLRRENFPATPRTTRVAAAISVVLAGATIGLAIYLGAKEAHEKGGGEHAALDRG
jgi:multisubunit Na+/H+ antiporter MnhB subunit